MNTKVMRLFATVVALMLVTTMVISGITARAVDFGTSTGVTLDNTADPSEQLRYGTGAVISPRAFFSVSDNSYSCLRLDLAIDPQNTASSYYKITDATWLELENATLTKNGNKASYQFTGLRPGSQIALPFPFQTLTSAPDGAKIPVKAELYTCSGQKLNEDSRTYTLFKELKANYVEGGTSNGWVNVKSKPDDSKNTANWNGISVIKYETNDPNLNVVPNTDTKCVYTLEYSTNRWHPTSTTVGAVENVNGRIVAQIPDEARLLPAEENPGWVYDLPNKVAYYNIPESEAKSSSEVPLRFYCAGRTINDAKYFNASIQIQDAAKPSSAWVDTPIVHNTYWTKIVLETPGPKIEKTNITDKEGWTTKLSKVRDGILVTQTSPSGEVISKKYNPQVDDPWSDNNYLKYRLHIYSVGNSTLSFNQIKDQLNTGEHWATIYGFQISRDSSPSAIAKLRKDGDISYSYYDKKTSQLSKWFNISEADTYNRINLPKADDSNTTWYNRLNIMGKYNSTQVTLNSNEHIYIDVVLKPNDQLINSIKEIDANTSIYNRGVIRDTEKSKDISLKQHTLEFSAVDTSFPVTTGSDETLSYSYCENEVSGELNYKNCPARFSRYMMAFWANTPERKSYIKSPDSTVQSLTILPFGLEYTGDLPSHFSNALESTNGIVETKLIPNYNGTGQQALLRTWKVGALLNSDLGRIEAPIQLEAKNYMRAGKNEIQTYWLPGEDSIRYFNTDLVSSSGSSNPVDFHANTYGYTDDKINIDSYYDKLFKQTTIYNFNPPRTAYIYKVVSTNKDTNVAIQDKKYGTYSEYTDNLSPVYYKYVLGSGPTELTTFDAIDVLPSVSPCDYNIADLRGEFGKRTWFYPGATGEAEGIHECSAFITPLTKNPALIAANNAILSRFNILYSTANAPSPVTGSQNITTKNDWNWQTASQITDWKAVTAFKLQLKPGQKINKDEELVLYTENQARANKNTFDQSLSVNQIAFTSIPENSRQTQPNQIKDWVRSNNAYTAIRVYRIRGNVFNDLNADGHRDNTDLGLSDYTVTIKDNTGKLVRTVTTDSNGNYASLISKPGDYTVEITPKTRDNFSTSTQPSTSAETNSTVNTAGKATVTVSDENREPYVNAGIFKYTSESVTTVHEHVAQPYKWTIENKVLDDNDSTKQYVSVDDREMRRDASDKTAISAPLKYQLKVKATPDSSATAKVIALKGEVTLKNLSPNQLTTDSATGVVLQLNKELSDVATCSFDDPNAVKNLTLAAGSESNPTVSKALAYTCTLKVGQTAFPSKVNISAHPIWTQENTYTEEQPATQLGARAQEAGKAKITDAIVSKDGTTLFDLGNSNFSYVSGTTTATAKLNTIELDPVQVGSTGLTLTQTTSINNAGNWQNWPLVGEGSRSVVSSARVVSAGDSSVGLSGVSSAVVNLSVRANATEVWVRKVGELDSARSTRKDLPGAVFELYKADTQSGLGTKVEGAVTAANAGETVGKDAFLFKVSGLEFGARYYLVETSAPSGYNLLPEAIGLSVSADGGVDVSMNGNAGVYLSVRDRVGMTSAGQQAKELQVYNAPVALLPFTGGFGVVVWGVLGVLAVGFASFVAYRVGDSLK